MMDIKYNVSYALSCLSVFALLGAGCGDDDGVAEFIDEYEQTMCTAMVACNEFPDVDTCRQVVLFEDSDEVSQIRAAIDAGRIAFDGGQGEACLDVLSQYTCEILASAVFFGELDDACGPVFAGRVELGGACLSSLECADQARCDVPQCPDACCEGACVAREPAPPLAAIGESCEVAECVPEAYCRYDLATNTQSCTARVAAGESCTSLDACVAGSYCDLNFMTGQGTCLVPPGQGQPCDPAQIVSCARRDNYCDAADAICKPRPAPGDVCDPELPLHCVAYATCVDSVCRAIPVEGEGCFTLDEVHCLGDLQCVNSVCTRPQPEPICSYGA